MKSGNYIAGKILKPLDSTDVISERMIFSMPDIIMASGPFCYAVDHHWAKLPDHIVWGNTHAVAVDSQDRIFIAHTSCEASPTKDTIVVFDPEGRYLYSWGEQFYGQAHGLTLIEEAGQELLLLVDIAHGIYKCTLDGEILQHTGKPAFYDENSLEFGAANVSVAPNSDLYLAEGYGSSFVLHFNGEGILLSRFGGWGEDEAHTRWAHGAFIAEVDGEPLLHVAVDDPSQIKRFTLDGVFHSLMPGTFLHPRNIYAKDNLWAIPEMGGRLTLIDQSTGKTHHLGHWGKTMQDIFKLRTGPRNSFPDGIFASAHGVACLSDGDMIVAEWVEVGRVSKLARV